MNIRQLLASKIVRRLLVVLLPLTALPILILGGVLTETGQQANRAAVLRDYQEIALRASGEIDLLIRGPQDMLTAMAAIVGITHTDPWKQETAVVEMRLNARGFERLVFADLGGRVRATGNLARDVPDSSFSASIREALRTITADPGGGFYRSDVYLLADKVPAMTMAAPVKRFGRPVGVLAAQVNLREMWTLVDRIHIGRTGRLYVVSHNGVVVAHRDKKHVLQREVWKYLVPVARVLRGQTGSLDYTRSSGDTYLAAYAPLPALDGGVVVEQPAAEAYATVATMRRQSWWIIAVSALAAIVIGVLVARSIVTPVLKLVEGTQRISRGDLTHSIELDRKDEIGQLALSFNEMARSLKASYDGLEYKVFERTSQLRHALEELRRVSEMKSEFVSDVAHELRTPLTAIQGYADTLIRLESTMTDAQRRQCCRTISEESRRVSRMINDLLDLSRIESGRVELRKAPAGIVPIAREAIAAAQPRAAGKNIRIELDASGPIPAASVDRDAIRRVFDNLIDNAIKYTPGGGTVSVSVSAEGDRIGVRVADTGIGIPEKDFLHIFDRFFRVKTPGARTPGTGLGLPIVKSIIEEHGGDITAGSTPGGGSTLSFTLPAASREGAPHEESAAAYTRS